MKLLLTIIFVAIFFGTSFSQDTTFSFTSRQVKNMNLVIEELKFKRIEVDSLTSHIAICKKEISILDLIVSMKDTIINLKEQQIRKLEQTPQTVTTVSNVKFLTWVMVVVSSVAGGLIVGFVLK